MVGTNQSVALYLTVTKSKKKSYQIIKLSAYHSRDELEYSIEETD